MTKLSLQPQGTVYCFTVHSNESVRQARSVHIVSETGALTKHRRPIAALESHNHIRASEI